MNSERKLIERVTVVVIPDHTSPAESRERLLDKLLPLRKQIPYLN